MTSNDWTNLLYAVLAAGAVTAVTLAAAGYIAWLLVNTIWAAMGGTPLTLHDLRRFFANSRGQP